MLSDTQIRAAKPRESAYVLSDGGGLRLLVQPNGGKLWRLVYRFAGKQRTMSFGRYPDVRLSDARDRRQDAKRLIASGTDPMADQTGDSFESVARSWHRVMKETWVPAHQERVLSRLERDVFPLMGNRPIANVDAPEVLRLLRQVEARGSLEIAKRLRQNIGQVFRFAVAEGRVARDPTTDLRGALKPSPRVRHMAATDDLATLVERIWSFRGAETTRLALQFTLLTAVRSNEIRAARWDEIDGDLWRIPAERMKMHRPHIVPLSTQAQAILDRMRVITSGDVLVVLNPNSMIHGLYKMGYRGTQTVHGFRRLFSTTLNEEGWNRDWVELQLAHAEENAIRGAYNAAQYLPGRTRMMQWWADHVMSDPALLIG